MYHVIKRDGRKEALDIDKLHKVVFWACEGITGVSESEIEIQAQLKFEDGIKTEDIQETLIKSAADLISEETPNYDQVAGRLASYHVRKQVYDDYEPWPLYKIVKTNVEAGIYDPVLLEKYTEDDWIAFDKIVKHERDNDIRYAGMEQYRGKYLRRHKNTGQMFESPQVALLVIAAVLFIDDPEEERVKNIKGLYDAVSTFKVSLPTPIMAACRSPRKQGASCVLIDVDDSLDSMTAATDAIVKYVSARAGLGINVGRIRAVGSDIRNDGESEHTGIIPFIRLFQSATKSCSQGGIRGGAATVYYQLWHYEFPELIVLKNNRGTEFNRVRQLDYAVQFNKLMYERLLSGGDISFFSPSEVPGLYDAFVSGDNDRFEELYLKYEADTSIRRKAMSAIDVFSMFVTERRQTGRIYLQNIDHANTHSTFKSDVAPITMSNLCTEINLPTKPLQYPRDPSGLIALCILSAINLGKLKTKHDFEDIMNRVVRALDALVDYQDYQNPAAERATKMYRSLGIGVINLAYFLAKNGHGYDEGALPLVDEYMEAMSFYAIKASVQLAKEKGRCPGFENTKWADGLFPHEHAKAEVNELTSMTNDMPWEDLRKDLLEYGIRNATLLAQMPAETSAQISNATNGIEPVRALVTDKTSKHGRLSQVVPEVLKLKNKYDLLWDQQSPEGYLKITCVMQRYMCQGISANISINPENYPDGKVSMMDMLKYITMFYKYGGKQLYYDNTYDGQREPEVEEDKSEELEVLDDEDCESCKL